MYSFPALGYFSTLTAGNYTADSHAHQDSGKLNAQAISGAPLSLVAEALCDW